MKINGIDFDFNPCNAKHVERMNAANAAAQVKLRQLAQRDVVTPDDAPAYLRAICDAYRGFIDGVLGAGAADALQMSKDDALQCQQLMADAFHQISAERERALHVGL